MIEVDETQSDRSEERRLTSENIEVNDLEVEED